MNGLLNIKILTPSRLWVALLVGLMSWSCQSGDVTIRKSATTAKGYDASMSPAAIQDVMRDVADWQIYHPFASGQTFWEAGALYTGMSAWANIAESDKYYSWLVGTGAYNGWRLYKWPLHADAHCVGQMYIEMYQKFHDPAMIKHIIERFDAILADPPQTSLDFKTRGSRDRWSWCDALFMAPPVWAKLARVTEEQKYLDFLEKEWWATVEFLYDKEEHLIYRDSTHFERREANGQKVFWGRGNGWTIAGLVRVLEVLPADYPSRPRYEAFYREYAARLAQLQHPDGLWRASLLDPQSYPNPETSASGFITYGLAWGVHHGLLDRDSYLPIVKKAWAGLVRCVHPDGMLGWTQPPGTQPENVTSNSTAIYGVGAFLLAGSEVYALSVNP